MKIIYMGTSLFSANVLDSLIQKYKVDLVVTKEDKPAGRGKKIQSSFVKKVALENNIKILQPNKIKEIITDIKKINPDLIITCAYGQILPKEILDIPKLGCINVHASLLPKLRGGAPIEHAIMDGYKETGITIMYMSEQMDAGDIISQKKIKIDNDNFTSLHDKLNDIACNLLLETLPSIIDKTNKRIAQDEKAVTYGMTIKKEDEQIDFNNNKEKILNQIKGLSHHRGAFCYFDNKVMKIWDAKIGDQKSSKENGEIINIYKNGIGVKVKDGEIIFTEIQLEGKKAMSSQNFINGHNDLLGKTFNYEKNKRKWKNKKD